MLDEISGTIGREEEWQALINVPKHAVNQRSIVYLWGPPGTGKSYLLQKFCDSLKNWSGTTVYTSAALVESTRANVLTHMSLQLPVGLCEPALEPLRAAIDAASSNMERLVWIIDDYDAWRSEHAWLWPVITQMRRHGACVVLAGRESPRRLWPGDLYAQVAAHRLNDFDDQTVMDLCNTMEVSDPAFIAEAIAISRGRPRLLCTMVDGYKLANDEMPHNERANIEFLRPGIASFLLEQVCHPGSRRLAWRAGQGNDLDVDVLLGAASLTTVFNRQILTAIAGPATVNHSWDALIALPFLDAFHGGLYGMPAPLRDRIWRAARQARPWMWEQWTRRAAAYFFEEAAHHATLQTEEFWSQILPLIRTKIGESLFETDEWSALDLRLEWTPDARHDDDGDGEIGRETQLADSDETLTAFRKDGSLAGFVVVDRRSVPRTMVVRKVDERVGESAAWYKMVAALLPEFVHYDRISWQVGEADRVDLNISRMLEHLGFVRDQTEWRLDLQSYGYVQWLKDILKAPQGRAPVKPAPVIQEALQVLARESKLEETELAVYWKRIGSPGLLRAWFLDALTSADLGTVMGGKTILALYYLDKQGTHEELAERLHMSRATYFRNHRTALDRLSHALFQ